MRVGVGAGVVPQPWQQGPGHSGPQGPAGHLCHVGGFLLLGGGGWGCVGGSLGDGESMI